MSAATNGVDKIRKALELRRNGGSAPVARAPAEPEPIPRVADPACSGAADTPVSVVVPAGIAPPGVDAAAVTPPRQETRRFRVDPARLRARRILAVDDVGAAAQTYKILRTQVLQAMRHHGYNSLAVLSPSSDEGRTVTAINLAASIAEDPEHTALLVDLDLRRPSIHEFFGASIDAGVESCLTGTADVASVLLAPEGYRKLVLLPAAKPVARSAEHLSSDSVRRLTAELNRRYANRIVLYDLPPLLETADALSFLPCVDAALLVVREGRTRRDDVVRCLQLMRDTPVIGTILNVTRESGGL
jgi:Mrp family chromosome partitioning ATPase